MKVWTGPIAGWGTVEEPGSAVTIGVFDGVHRGHRAVIAELVSFARELGLTAAGLTFDRHPLTVVSPERAPLMLTSADQRLQEFAKLGLDLAAVLPFLEIRELAPEVFVQEVLQPHFRPRLVTVGEDFRYGRDRGGDVSTLREAGERLGFDVRVVTMVAERDGPVSASRIRRLVAAGKVEDAAEDLGRLFELRGEVVEGDGRGRIIGFPTANLAVPSGMLLPGNGVYAARAIIEEKEWPAMVNVGLRPTFGGDRLTVEAHILDFSGDLYGKELALRFVARLRDELRFDTVDELVDQIRRDVEVGRRLLIPGGGS